MRRIAGARGLGDTTHTHRRTFLRIAGTGATISLVPPGCVSFRRDTETRLPEGAVRMERSTPEGGYAVIANQRALLRPGAYQVGTENRIVQAAKRTCVFA